jgi:hypothetical protein
MMYDLRYLFATIVVGLGATLLIDLWAVFLRRAFDIRSLDYCLLGRWLLHMPNGTFRHPSIAAAPSRPRECGLGWAAHYLIGTSLALMFVLLVSARWLDRPTLLPALSFGVVTVLIPFLVMQPSFGLGLYLWALVVSRALLRT